MGGVTKAHGLNHCAAVRTPPAGGVQVGLAEMGPLWKGLPTSFALSYVPALPVSAMSPLAVTWKAWPDRAVTIPFHCQPPIT